MYTGCYSRCLVKVKRNDWVKHGGPRAVTSVKFLNFRVVMPNKLIWNSNYWFLQKDLLVGTQQNGPEAVSAGLHRVCSVEFQSEGENRGCFVLRSVHDKVTPEGHCPKLFGEKTTIKLVGMWHKQHVQHQRSGLVESTQSVIRRNDCVHFPSLFTVS